MPFDYDGIRHIIEDGTDIPASSGSAEKSEVHEKSMQKHSAEDNAKSASSQSIRQSSDIPKIIDREKKETGTKPTPETDGPQTLPGHVHDPERVPDMRISKALRDLMIAGDVDEWDLQAVVNDRQPGVFPLDMPVKDYPQDFVNEWIIPNWERILEYVADMKEKTEIPFN